MTALVSGRAGTNIVPAPSSRKLRPSLDDGAGFGARRHEHCSSADIAAGQRYGFLEPVYFVAVLKQTIHQDERVVLLVIDQITGAAGAKNRRGRRMLQTVYFFERTIESIQDAIELDAHLERQRVSGDIVGRNGRTAGITEIVGVILRFEHIENVGAKGLRSLDNPGTCWIMFARDVEDRGGAMDCDTGLDEGRSEE